jgi:hypothetical protein
MINQEILKKYEQELINIGNNGFDKNSSIVACILDYFSEYAGKYIENYEYLTIQYTISLFDLRKNTLQTIENCITKISNIITNGNLLIVQVESKIDNHSEVMRIIIKLKTLQE